jgi:hypothetical protein
MAQGSRFLIPMEEQPVAIQVQFTDNGGHLLCRDGLTFAIRSGRIDAR